MHFSRRFHNLHQFLNGVVTPEKLGTMDDRGTGEAMCREGKLPMQGKGEDLKQRKD